MFCVFRKPGLLHPPPLVSPVYNLPFAMTDLVTLVEVLLTFVPTLFLPLLSLSIISLPLEATAVCVHRPSLTLTVVSLYLPPQLALDSLISNLSSLVSWLSSPFLICTDAIAHQTSWGSPTSDCCSNLLVDWLAENYLALVKYWASHLSFIY